MDISHQNANRFSNFAGLYDRVRPALPHDARVILRQYLGRQVGTLVDIGCGTERSTVGWADAADEVAGVEPSLPMMQLAQK